MAQADGSGGAARSDGEATQPPSTEPAGHVELPWWRRALPFVLALGLVSFVLSRIDWPSFWIHLLSVNYAGFVGFMVVFIVSLLAADTLATRYVYRRTIGPVGYRDLFVIRGASYLPSVVNHHLGQAWLTYFIARVYGVHIGRVAGATLLVYATWGGCVVGLGCIGMLTAGMPMGWLAVPLGLGIGYLVLLAVRPKALARNRVLGPLMEAGVGGHIMAMALRLPHSAVLFLGTWLPFHFFGVPVPFTVALTYVPIIMVAVTLPITPQGFGTRDVLAATFFSGFASVTVASSPEQQLAAVAAATMTQGVVITIIGLLMGALLMPRATRLRRAGERRIESGKDTATSPDTAGPS